MQVKLTYNVMARSKHFERPAVRQCVELRRDSSRRKHQQQGSKWRNSECENLDHGCKTFNEK